MKKLIIARHGSYGGDKNLNDEGKKEMRVIAEKIQQQIANGDRVALLTSTAPRARQSAEIVADLLAIELSLLDLLWSDASHQHNFEKVYQVVSGHQNAVEVLIMITHLEYGEGFPQYFSNKELGGVRMSGEGIEKGEAWIIDCEQRRMVLITSP